MKFVKGPKKISEQIQLLKDRGLLITDERFANHYLNNISYYRLSAYMLSFQKFGVPGHTFMPWATFERVLDLYVFDRELRLTVMDAIERIEVAFRCRIIYEYSLRYGNNWYEDPQHYTQGHDNLQKKVKEQIRLTKEVFIQHYKGKYNDPVNPPAWMTLEVLSFGQLSILFKNLKTSDAKKAIGDHFGVHHELLVSWIEHLAYIRNICAHHSRLWNRILTVKASLPKITADQWLTYPPQKADKLYLSLCITKYLLKRINPTSTFPGRLRALFCKHPELDMSAMGFPLNWKSDTFWSNIQIPLRQRIRILYYKTRSYFVKTNV